MTANEYDIYTDGSCSGNPGPGGWAALIKQGDSINEITGNAAGTTNQRMELFAALEALRNIPSGSRVRLHSDSAYLVNCFNEGWMERWKNNNWLNAKRVPVENQDLWKQLDQLAEQHSVEWIKVKGHGTDELNQRCDQLARKAIERNKNNIDQQMLPPVAHKLGHSVMKKSNQKIRRIGLLTGGGDCPGLNAVIRAVVKSAIYNHSLEVVGFHNGFEGLVDNDASLLSDLMVSGIINRGGTILGTSNRGNPFDYKVKGSDYSETGEDRSGQAIENLNSWDVECLVVIGGDGSMYLGHRFSELGVPVIGIPKTIDNDVPATDVTFGFDSAVTTATEAIDKIHTTAESHHRVMVVEVMGRYAGWIALYAGMAGGGDIILIPEIPFGYEAVIDKIMDRRSKGKKFSIIVVAEGAHLLDSEPVYQEIGSVKRLGGIGSQISQEIEKRTTIESRATVLGHLQRGGSPTAFDRILATRFGVKAIELFLESSLNRMVSLRGTSIESVPLSEVVPGNKLVDPEGEQVKAAQAVGTSFGRV